MVVTREKCVSFFPQTLFKKEDHPSMFWWQPYLLFSTVIRSNFPQKLWLMTMYRANYSLPPGNEPFSFRAVHELWSTTTLKRVHKKIVSLIF